MAWDLKACGKTLAECQLSGLTARGMEERPVGHSDFDVMRDGGAQLKAYQRVSKSTPISLVTSNKRLLYCSSHLINLTLFACQDEVITEERIRQTG